MKIHLSAIILVLFCITSSCQSLTGSQLLDKAIAHHDPNGNWATFNGELNVTMETPNGPDRESKIVINLAEDHFYVKATKDTLTTEYTVTKDNCSIAFNGNSHLDEETLKAHNLSCERAHMYKNYYTYLYGLPMKLKDPGTNVHETIEQKTFKGKDYLVLKVSYDEAVGSDVWYFYFDPKTFAMEVYQFFKTDDKGLLKPESGEYILLTENVTINEVKIPKNRAWYYNSNDKYLGTDFLK